MCVHVTVRTLHPVQQYSSLVANTQSHELAVFFFISGGRHWKYGWLMGGVKVLWCQCYIYFIGLVFEGSITTCTCFHLVT